MASIDYDTLDRYVGFVPICAKRVNPTSGCSDHPRSLPRGPKRFSYLSLRWFKGGKILHAQSYPTKSDALVGPGSIRELSEMEDIRFFAELSFFS